MLGKRLVSWQAMFMLLLVSRSFLMTLVYVTRFKKRQVQPCTILPKDLNQVTTRNLYVF